MVDSLHKVVSAVNPPIDGTSTPSATGGDWLDARQDAVWRLLLSVHSRLVARLDEEMRIGHGLNLADYEVLGALSEADGSLRMTELAQRVMLSPSGLTRRVDRLVGRGLVSRRACPSDGRGSLAALTTAGWADLRCAAPTHLAGVRRYLIDALSAEGIEELACGLEAVGRAVGGDDRVDGPTRPVPDARPPGAGLAIVPATGRETRPTS